MILIEVTINGTLHRVSSEGIALTHYWDADVVSFDSPQVRIEYDYGGYAKSQFGSIEFFPDLFAADWPPPPEITVGVYYTATDEASKELFFTGRGFLQRNSREGVRYALYGPSYTSTIAAATAYNTTLNSLFTTWCGAGLLNLTLNTTYARASSPSVNFTVPVKCLLIDLASRVAAFFSHLFYISGSTLYLIDMKLNNGSELVKTEYDFFPSEYEYRPPIAEVATENYSRQSSYPYGRIMSGLVEYHPTEANINTALDDILATLNAPVSRLRIPLLGSLPSFGQKVSGVDASLGASTDFWFRVRGMRYDFLEDEMMIEGEGAVSAS